MYKDNKYKTLFWKLYNSHKEIYESIKESKMKESIILKNKEIIKNMFEAPENVDIFVKNKSVIYRDNNIVIELGKSKLNKIKNWKLDGTCLKLNG